MTAPGTSRRTVLGILVGGVVVAPLAVGADAVSRGLGAPATGDPDETAKDQAAKDPAPEGLLATLAVGAKLAEGTVKAVEPPAHGALRVRVEGAAGQEYCLEVLARDHSANAPRPPAETDHYSVFVSNGGRGASATAEEHARAALALAAVIAEREQAARQPGLLTHRTRLEQHPGAMLEHIDGSAPVLV